MLADSDTFNAAPEVTISTGCCGTDHAVQDLAQPTAAACC